MIRSFHIALPAAADRDAYEAAWLPAHSRVISMVPAFDGGVVIEVEYPDDGAAVEVYDPPRKWETW